MNTWHREAKYIINHINKASEYISDEIDAHKRVTSATRANHAEMKRSLMRCMELMDLLLEQDNAVFDETVADDLCDLDDTLAILEDRGPEPSSEYDPKYIVRSYATRLASAVEDDYLAGEASNIVVILESWFTNRFTGPHRDPNFRYKASKIPDWIDSIILSYGKSLHDGTEAEFRSDLRGWISELSSNPTKWPIPLCARSVSPSSRASDYTQEAVLIERLVKSHLYDEKFYPERLSSIASVVKDHNSTVELDNITIMFDRCSNINRR